MSRCVVLLVALLSLGISVEPFGFLGHTLSASIAQTFLTPRTQKFIQDLLPTEYQGKLDQVVLWADQIKHQKEYRWSKQLHYVNAKDYPPQFCDYQHLHACRNFRCVVSAINNYTSLLDPRNEYISDDIRVEALKFLIHFIGDIHQPLHSTGRDQGGLRTTVAFHEHNVSLHWVWDHLMLNKAFKEIHHYDYDRYRDHLIHKIKYKWRDQVLGWLECPRSRYDNEKEPDCSIHWATQINMWNCLHVYQNLEPYMETSTWYYTLNIDVVETGLSMSAVRMAHVLNSLFDEEYNPTDFLNKRENPQKGWLGRQNGQDWSLLEKYFFYFYV